MASQNPDKDDSKETIGNIEEISLLSNGTLHFIYLSICVFIYLLWLIRVLLNNTNYY